MHPSLDSAAFREQFEKACRQAVHDYRALPCEETHHRACGRLEGLLLGIALLRRTLPGTVPEAVLEYAREVVERFRPELGAPAP